MVGRLMLKSQSQLDLDEVAGAVKGLKRVKGRV